MLPADLFRHCPRCAAARGDGPPNPFRCGGCGLTYFFNPTVAAGAFVFDTGGRALFVRRAKEPAKGKLGLPGGFIDPGETAEGALRREVMEEVGLEVEGIQYFVSYPNLYLYREVTYPVVDLLFTCRAVAPDGAVPLDGVDAVVWRELATLDPDELAFPSMREGLRVLRGGSS